MYAMVLTRPDICFSIGQLSQYMSRPIEQHDQALKGLIRYLMSTVTQRLRYGPKLGGAKTLVLYSDAD